MKQVRYYTCFTLCQQCQVDEIILEGYAERMQPILTDDVIMKFDLNTWAVWVRQGLRLLVSKSLPVTQGKNIS